MGHDVSQLLPKLLITPLNISLGGNVQLQFFIQIIFRWDLEGIHQISVMWRQLRKATVAAASSQWASCVFY